MAGTTLSLTLPLGAGDARAGLEVAREAAGWGYGACWLAEIQGPDAFTQLGALAVQTDLELGVAVVPVQTRTPFVLAMSAVTLHELSGGRFTLGVGSSAELIVREWAGQPFDAPYTHVRETVEALQPVLAGERSSYEGRHVRMRGYRPHTPLDAPIPLYVGALGPRTLALAGAQADGVCLNQIAPWHVPDVLAHLRRGAAEAGRTLPEDFGVVARLFCAVTDEPETARAGLKRMFAPYVATSVYNAHYRRLGYTAEAEAVAEAAAARDRDAMTAAMSDRLIDDVFVVGDVGAVVDKVRAYVDAGVTTPVIAPVVASVEEARAALQAVAEAW